MGRKFTKQDVIETRDELCREIDLLRAKITEKQALIASFDRILRDYFKTDEEGNLPPAEAIDPSCRFVGMSNSEAILKFLDNQGDKLFSPAEITRGLRAGGMTSDSPRFDTIVMNECLRLVRRGQLDKVSDYGNFLYRLKKPGGEES
jgi:hypothetical protein